MNNKFILVPLKIYENSLCLIRVRNASNWCMLLGIEISLFTGVLGLKEPH